MPNLIHMVLALAPIALYFIFRGGLLQQIYLIVLLMFGGLYFPLVWQTHMMKTFALFHPVEVKKKKQSKQQDAVTMEQEQHESKSKKGKQNGKSNVERRTASDEMVDKTQVVANDSVKVENITDSEISNSESDAYAMDDDAYAIDKSNDDNKN